MKIAVAGGDLRMLTVAKMFEKSGWECSKFGLGETDVTLKDAINGSVAVILPLPCSKGGYLNAPMSNDLINIGDVFSAGDEKTVFLGGKMPTTDETHIDYSIREEFELKNAVPTAEGAIAIAMSELNITLNGANAVIVGYGRIGSYLANILKAMNCKTSVIARRESTRTLAKISGHAAFDFGHTDSYKTADIVFNTVPFTVIGERELSAMNPNASMIDLASLPGGVDEISAKKHNVKVIHALALPGKTAPETAGKIIFETTATILRERGICV